MAGRRDDTDHRRTMVAAVRQGVPWSFTLIITSIGVGIPQNYDKWKERILIMYEERQQDRAYNDAHSIGQCRPRQRKEARELQTDYRPQQKQRRGRDKFLRWKFKSRLSRPLAYGSTEDVRRTGRAHERRRTGGEEGKAARRRALLPMQRKGAPEQGLPRQEGSSACRGHDAEGAASREHEGGGGKRVGRRAPDSAATTKDLHTGERSSSVGRSDTFISQSDTISIVHSNIPPPHVLGQACTTSTRPPPVLESNNQYSILPIEDTNDSSLGNDSDCQSPSTKLTKRLASSSLRVNALNEKMTTISSPVLTTVHQSRPPFKPQFQAAVPNARSDGAERALSTNCDQAALLVGKVPPRGSSRTGSSEEIGTDAETSPGTERNARRLKSKISPSGGFNEDRSEPSRRRPKNRRGTRGGPNRKDARTSRSGQRWS